MLILSLPPQLQTRKERGSDDDDDSDEEEKDDNDDHVDDDAVTAGVYKFWTKAHWTYYCWICFSLTFEKIFAPLFYFELIMLLAIG